MKKKEEISKINKDDLDQLLQVNEINVQLDIKKIFNNSLISEFKNNDLLKECFPLSDEEIINNYISLKKVIDQDTNCKLANQNSCPYDGYHFSASRNSESNFLTFHYKICKKLEFQVLYRENQENFLYNSFALLKIFPVLNNEKEVTISKNNFLKAFFNIFEKDEIFGIYLYGKPGVGKTHLFKLLCNEILSAKKKTKTVALINLVDLVETTKSSFSNKDNPKYFKLMDAIINADYLFFDDLGSEYATDWFYSNVFLNILNNRLSTSKATFFNSNFTLIDYWKKIINSCKLKDKEIVNRIIVRIQRLVKKRVMEIKDQKYT